MFLGSPKKMMQKLSLLVVLMLVLSPTGCTDKNDSEESSVTSSETESKSELVELPSFLSGTIGEAEDFLDENGLNYTVVYEYIDSVSKYTVISQEPKAGSMIAPGSEVKLVVAMDTQSRVQSKPESSKSESSNVESSRPESRKPESSKPESSKPSNNLVEVPYIVGMQAATAQNTLSALDLYYTGNYEYDSKVPAGEVISQSPQAGTQVKEYSRVTFIISNGPMPEVKSEPVSEPEVSSQEETSSFSYEAGGERYVGTYTGFRPIIKIESMGSDIYYINVMWSSSAYDGMSYEFYAEYNPVSDTLEYEDGEAYYYKYNAQGQMVEYSLYDEDYLGYFKLYSHNDLRWGDMKVGIDASDSFTRN